MSRVALALLLLLAAAAAHAAEPFVAETGVLSSQVGPLEKAAPAAACLLGVPYNDNAAGYYNRFLSGESYAVLMDPAACPACDIGFQVTRARMALQLQAGTFMATCSLRAAVPYQTGCYVPGAELAVSPVYEVTVGAAGGAIVSLPWTSPCLYAHEPYFLVWTMATPWNTVVGPYVDNDGTTPCLVYNDRGSGWEDLVYLVGDVLLWAELDCCDLPVPAEDGSWGALKKLYE